MPDCVATISCCKPAGNGFPSARVKSQIGDIAKIIAAVDLHDIGPLRSAIRNGTKLQLRLRSEAGEETERTLWPVNLGCTAASHLLVAWCELRQSFRYFRTDRIIKAEMLDEINGLREGGLRRHGQP